MRSPFNYRFGLPSPFYDNETGSFSPAALFALAEPGVWYDPSDVANLAWRRNLLQWTQEFDNPLWQKQTGTTVTANTQTAPDGTLTADTVTATAGNQVFQSGVSVLSGSSYAVSFSIRKTTGATVFPLISLESGTAAGQVILNTNTGVANVRAGVPGAANLSVASQGDYWRLSYSTTLNGSTAGVSFYPAASTDGINYFGGLSGSQVIWGAQLELGTVATTYQPITTVDAGTIERFPNATLYQDTAGTIPVTGPTNLAGNPSTVALMLDKSKNLALGSELVVNGDFSSGTGWSLGAGWSISGGKLNWAGAFDRAEYNAGSNAFVAGRYYKVTLTVSGNTSGTVVAFLNLTGNARINSFSISGNGEKTFFLFAGVNCNGFILEGNSATGAMSLDNISVRELPGNHAVQGTIASRPTYGVVPQGGRRNLLTFSEDQSNAIWTKGGFLAFGSGSTVDAAVAPNGTMSADSLVENTAAATAHGTYNSITSASGVSHTFSVYLKFSGRQWVDVEVGGLGNTPVYFDIVNGVVGVVGSGRTAAITNAGNGWFRCSVTAVVPSTTAVGQIFLVQSNGGSLTYTGDGTSGVLIWGAQLEQSATITPYQRVTTQYDVTEAGVPSCSYLFFDGASDFMVSSTITPGIDKAQVFAGVRKLSDAAAGAVAEFSPSLGSNSGAFLLGAPLTPASTDIVFRSKGTATGEAASTGQTAPITRVATGLGDISGDSTTLRLNGIVASTGTGDQGTGNYLAYPLFVGSRGNAGPPYTSTSLPFNGELFGLITRFGPNLDATTINATEYWVGDKTGINIANNTSATIFARDNTAVLDRFNQIIERRA